MSKYSNPLHLVARAMLACTLAAPAVDAQTPAVTPELTRLAECNRIAGTTTGTERETLIAGCMEPVKAPAPKTDAAAAAQKGDVAEQKSSGLTAATGAAATAEVTKPAAPGGLPGQATILGCAAEINKLSGEARSKALKACLAGGTPAVDARAELCAAQAKSQAPAERAAFLAACQADKTPVPATATAQAARAAREEQCQTAAKDRAGAEREAFLKTCIDGKSEAVAAAENEQRQRANCNVIAGAREGEVRKSFVAECMAKASAMPRTRAAAMTPASEAGLSQRCAAEARAKLGPNQDISGYLMACMGGAAPGGMTAKLVTTPSHAASKVVNPSSSPAVKATTLPANAVAKVVAAPSEAAAKLSTAPQDAAVKAGAAASGAASETSAVRQ